MKLRSLIIDDEPLAHKIILTYARDIPFLDIVGHCHLPLEALEILRNQPVDLIFLDINMPRIKGLELLRTLSTRPQVIITSAHEEYALESFELDVCDYLLKPFRFDRFLKAVNKARGLLETSTGKATSEHPTEESQTRQLFLKVDKRMINVDLTEVFYLESYGNYVKVWMKDNFHLTPRTLASFTEQLPLSKFFRIHKSYIINRTFIDYVEGNSVLMKNGKQLPIGKNQRSAFKRFITG